MSQVILCLKSQYNSRPYIFFIPPNIFAVAALGLNKAQYVLLGVLHTEHFVIAELDTCKNPRLSKFSLKQSTVA